MRQAYAELLARANGRHCAARFEITPHGETCGLYISGARPFGWVDAKTWDAAMDLMRAAISQDPAPATDQSPDAEGGAW